MMKDSSPLIIEFVGLPGAGKTTVLHQVIPPLQAEGLSIVHRDQILQSWQNHHWAQRTVKLIPQTHNQWSILFQSLSFAAQVKPTTLQSFSKATKIFSNAKRLDAVYNQALQVTKSNLPLAPHRNRQIVLLDQGLLQEIWSVGITGHPPTSTSLRQVLAPLVKMRSLAIVYFKIDVETALQRIQSRSTASSRFDQMKLEVARSRLVQHAPVLEEIVSCSQTLGTPALEINSQQSIAAKVEKIASWIRSTRSQATAICPASSVSQD